MLTVAHRHCRKFLVNVNATNWTYHCLSAIHLHCTALKLNHVTRSVRMRGSKPHDLTYLLFVSYRCACEKFSEQYIQCQRYKPNVQLSVTQLHCQTLSAIHLHCPALKLKHVTRSMRMRGSKSHHLRYLLMVFCTCEAFSEEYVQ